ncbi:AMP-binding protein [Streptomyces sp. 11x1]|uniref:AMP-binding protein n=1 Tax=Streptomyces sp. 11x1 TaxID=3038642 RepID=UPI00292D6F07|nr:AMP-binding protein [Streptomyces sp. 11x1]WNZ06253.1 AMP-binding protein [Streptomyces sp. 11x1]
MTPSAASAAVAHAAAGQTTAHHELLHSLLLSKAAVDPDAPAVVEFVANGSVRTTRYQELGDLARAYAADLRALGLDIGDRVILESHTSAHAIAMFLACSMAGLPFVPVSPETPDQRLSTIMEATGAALHLQTEEGAREGVPAEAGLARFGSGRLAVERAPRPRTRRRTELCPTDTAYMIFTSGTTGRPKGVVMSHHAVTSFYRGMLTQGIVGPGDRVATTSPLQFDFSLLDIGLALGSGAAVVPVPRGLLRWPNRFLRVLSDTGATQVNGVPSIWRQSLRHLPDGIAALTGVRGVLFCGEDFPLPELRRLQELLPQARLINCYGATESMACSFTDVPRPLPADLEKLSIGYAHPGAEMLLVDESGAVLEEPGVLGEIHLRTPALFTGYWDDPAASAAARVPDPAEQRSGQLVLRTGDLAYRGPQGELYFCGRLDSQVQIRGNRVELGEVERRLRDHPAVAEAVVLLVEREGLELRLVACLVTRDGTDLPADGRLTAFCSEALQSYMVPDEFHFLAALPVSPNGKADRRALASRLAEVA